MKLVIVVGARPEFVKTAMVSRLLRSVDGVQESFGSERESGKVPNWRGFQDFEPEREIGCLGHWGRWRASRQGFQSRWLVKGRRRSSGMDGSRDSMQHSHSVMIDKMFSPMEETFQGCSSSLS